MPGKDGAEGLRLTRRRFLMSTGLGAAGLVLGDLLMPVRRAHAKPIDDRLFIFAYFEGGWDVLMSLDPRDPATNDPAKSGIDLAWSKIGGRWATMGWDGPGSRRHYRDWLGGAVLVGATDAVPVPGRACPALPGLSLM